MIRYTFIFVCALLSTQVQSADEKENAENYRLGIYPYMPPRQTVELYGPVAASIQTELKHPVKLESLPSFPEFMLGLKKYQFDIALIQPFDYPEVVEKLGYLPVARIAAPLVAQFFVRADSSYQHIKDLRGTRIAMPPEQAATSRMSLRALYDNKLTPGTNVEIRYFNSHDSCLQQVWTGAASACGTAKPPVLVFEQRMQAKFRSIYDTPPIPHALIVASPQLPATQRIKLQKLITGWNNNERGRLILKNLGFPGFDIPKPDEYAMMQKYDPLLAIKKHTIAEKKEMVMGVFPFLGARQLAQNFGPALTALSKASGKPIHLQTAKNYELFDETISNSKYDIVVIQPFDYALASSHGYLPLAQMKNKMHGEFYVLNNSPYNQITDLKGSVVAMSNEGAAISRLARYAFIKAGLKTDSTDIIIDYRKNYNSCLQQVQHNAASACVTSPLTLNMVPKELRQNLRSIGRTETLPGPLFMLHKRLPANYHNKLLAEINSWKDTEHGRRILDSIGFGDLAPANSTDYMQLPKL